MSSRKRAKNRGRKAEARVADFFGTVRTPLSGSNSRHTASDTLHERLFIEVKARASHPIRRWYEARRGPLVVLDDSAAGLVAITHSRHWEEVRKVSSRKVLREAEDRIKRAKTYVGRLLDKTGELAKKEGKVPMACLIDMNKHGFLICVHMNHWDEARKEGEDVEDQG